ncbi:hypothetical protein FHQ25_11235, partial [Testudinibacter sp. TR-2022]|uniref:alanine-zipper protein n=3 Tax=Testudinibacter sp. TR-2022 TaxID=2585029 RepID=UPI0011751122
MKKEITVAKDSASTVLNVAGKDNTVRRVTGVANGTQAGDAVNKQQLDGVKSVADSAKATADGNKTTITTLQAADTLNVKYTTAAKDTVALGGNGGSKISNLKAGTADSDAANVGQLNRAVSTATTTITNNINNGTLGLVRDDKTLITVAKDSSTATVSLLGANGLKRKLSGLADGTISETSDEAVTGAQFKKFQAEVEKTLANGGTGGTGTAADPNMVTYDFGSDKSVLTFNADKTKGSGDGSLLKGVKDGVDKTDAVNKGQLDGVKAIADNAKTTADNAKTTADNAKTTADEAKDIASNLKDGVDGLQGVIGTAGKDGLNGKGGAAGQDGLNGKDAISQIVDIRQGEAGTVVYTDANGNRLSVEDGKYYQRAADGSADKSKEVAANAVRLSAVNADGTTTAPTVLGNLADGKLAADSKEAVTGGQLFTVKTTADNAKTTADNAKTTADNAKTTADEAKDIASNLKDGVDGLQGVIGTAGKDGLNGKGGAAG